VCRVGLAGATGVLKEGIMTTRIEALEAVAEAARSRIAIASEDRWDHYTLIRLQIAMNQLKDALIALDAAPPDEAYTEPGMLSGVAEAAYHDGAAAERTKTVAWLRARADVIERRTAFSIDITNLRAIAYAIEGGEHAKAGDEK
jgi:hypothetical protein